MVGKFTTFLYNINDWWMDILYMYPKTINWENS